MPPKRCENGHHYDPQKHSSCPYCGVPGLDLADPGPTTPAKSAQEIARTVPVSKPPAQRPLDEGRRGGPDGGLKGSADDGDDRTIRRGMEQSEIDPVVGWLVCTDGPERGRDYRIRSHKNFVGRSEEMHICIRADKSINRVKHAVVSFNPRNRSFKLSPGEGTGLVYLNGEDLDVPTVLKPYDVIEVGRSKLVFIPLCGEHFLWEEMEK